MAGLGGSSGSGYMGQGSMSNGTSTQNGTINTTSAGATNSTTIANTTGQGQTQGTQNNTYQPWQSGLQQQVGQAAGNFLQTGNLPGTFGTPQVVTDAYISNWKQNVAPMLAAQYGAGSPALGSSLALGLQQLQAQVYQNQSNNFSNALSSAGNTAFTATGNTSNSNQSQSENAKSNTTSAWWQNQDQTINMANAASNTGLSKPQF